MNQDTETWHVIPDTMNKYYLSDKGRVKRIYESGKEKILKNTPNSRGYEIVSITFGKRQKTTTVNSLKKMVFGATKE